MNPSIDGLDDLELIGRGGFSVVYRAYQRAFERQVAVKLLECDGTDDEVRATVDRECAAAGRLGAHPNIVTLFDRGTAADGRPYLVMELLPKGSLHDRARSAPLATTATVDIAVKVGGAIETSHRAGTLHRDVKPHNVLFSAADEPILVDFGLAVVFGANASSMVPAGFTPAFAAPELLVGHPATVASDVYSFAATLYFCLTGTAPVTPDDESYVTFVGRVLSTRPEAPTGLGRRQRDALMAALEVQPTARPASIAEFVDEFATGSGSGSGSGSRGPSMVLLDDITIDPDRLVPEPVSIEGLGVAGPAKVRPRVRAFAAVAGVALVGAGIGVGALLPDANVAADRSGASTGATTGPSTGSSTTAPSPTSRPLRTRLLELEPGSSEFAIDADLPPASSDTSSRLALAMAGIPDLMQQHLGLAALPLRVPEHPDVDVPTRGRTLAANKRTDTACRSMRTRDLTMIGANVEIWQSSGVYVVGYLWQFADHGGVTAEDQVADAFAAGAMQLGVATGECSGFGDDGLALDGDVSIAYNDLATAGSALSTSDPIAVRADTDVPIGPTGGIHFKYAYRMMLPRGDRLLRVDVYSAETPLSPLGVEQFLASVRDAIGATP